METYKSNPQRIGCDIDTIYNKLSSPAVFRAHIEANRDRLPEEARANLDKVQFQDDAISIESPMGELRLAIDADQSASPNRVVYTAAQSPVQFNMVVELNPVSETETESVASLQLDLPLFMRAMVGNQLQQAVSKFGEMLAQMPYQTL